MIPSTPQFFLFGFAVTAWFSIAAIPYISLFSLSLSLSFSLIISISSSLSSFSLFHLHCPFPLQKEARRRKARTFWIFKRIFFSGSGLELGLWVLTRKECSLGDTRGAAAMAGNRNPEIGASPSNVGQQQRRVYQVWRGGNVRLYLNFCFELVFMSHNWIVFGHDSIFVWIVVHVYLCFNYVLLIFFLKNRLLVGLWFNIFLVVECFFQHDECCFWSWISIASMLAWSL